LFSPPELLNSAKTFCRKHKILRELRTPERNHIVFPEANGIPEPEGGAPMEQDFPKANGVPATETLEGGGAPMEQDVPEENEAPYQPPPRPPAAASNQQNQSSCSCSGPLTFAPSSLYMQPYPGSCGWIDD
jgi:hypothetical protein